MIAVHLVKGKSIPFTPRSLVWARGTVRSSSGDPGGDKPLYTLEQATTAGAGVALQNVRRRPGNLLRVCCRAAFDRGFRPFNGRTAHSANPCPGKLFNQSVGVDADIAAYRSYAQFQMSTAATEPRKLSARGSFPRIFNENSPSARSIIRKVAIEIADAAVRRGKEVIDQYLPAM